ncbi:MAG: hypothetical protein Q9208_006648 [Pyrenodesmia sp. 3 TL-2023]
MDFLDGHGALVDQDAHWDLLSKRTLALSGLPSPPTEVIDSMLLADETSDQAVLAKETDRMVERQQLFVDMNICQTGSYTLGLMMKHFFEQRNLPLGGLVCPIALQGGRDHIEEKFAGEIQAGTLVVAAWCESPRGILGYSACELLLGAEIREQVQTLMAQVASVAIEK